jgi:hypothetical protein
MDPATTADAETASSVTASDSRSAQRVFNVSMVISGIRCLIAYVLLPFVTPFLGLAPGIGPGLGIVIGLVALASNGYSLNRFWRLRHRWRKPITLLHVSVIGLLLVLLAQDMAALGRAL